MSNELLPWDGIPERRDPALYISRDVDGATIHQRRADGYIDATAMCRVHGKLFANWRQLDGTQEYLEWLAADIGIPISDLVQSTRGGDSRGGTWVHPEVAIDLAHWLSPPFRVLVNRWVLKFIRGEQPEVRQQDLNALGALKDILARIAQLPTRGDTRSIDDRVQSLQRTAYEIQERLFTDVVKRRDAPPRNQDIYDQTLYEYYMAGGEGNPCKCPCCNRTDRIIIRHGEHTRLYHLDHATGNPRNNGLHEMWPVCQLCNGKLKNDATYRFDTMDRFRVFQGYVQEIIGRRLI